LVPSQTSGTSQAPRALRQTRPAGATLSGGQVVETPSQNSVTSQGPTPSRQTVVFAAVAPQIPLTAAPALLEQAWQSLGSLPPQAVEQQTPSAQKPDAHWVGSLHAWPRFNVP
jgi:hypothetical protein